MNESEELLARLEKVERRLEQMGGLSRPAESNAKRTTITFCVTKAWSANDLLQFCQTVNLLYGILLVQSESERDEDCRGILLEWDKSLDVVLAYRRANDADYTDGHLLIESVDLRPQGVISLRGWTAPIERLRQLAGAVPRRMSVKKQTKAVQRSVPRTKLLKGAERRRLVAILLGGLADLETLGAAAC